MKELIETTTGDITTEMNLTACGDYPGKFQYEACKLLEEFCDLPEFRDNDWTDIMYDSDGNVYAIWAEDSLTCYDAEAKYIQLDYVDCEQAFDEMNEKI